MYTFSFIVGNSTKISWYGAASHDAFPGFRAGWGLVFGGLGLHGSGK